MVKVQLKAQCVSGGVDADSNPLTSHSRVQEDYGGQEIHENITNMKHDY